MLNEIPFCWMLPTTVNALVAISKNGGVEKRSINIGQLSFVEKQEVKGFVENMHF